MRYGKIGIAMLSALCLTACGVSRTASKVESSTFQDFRLETRDTVVKEVVVAMHDTLREVTTITIRENEHGDTLRVTQVTDREKVRNRDAVAAEKVAREVKTDTVYIERHDSVEVSSVRFRDSDGQAKSKPAWLQGLKWIFWIVVAVIALVLVIRFFGK